MLAPLRFAFSSLFCFTVLTFFYFKAYRYFMPICPVAFSLALAFCLSPAFVFHYAFIIMLFYHVTVSFVVGCLARVSCLLRQRIFFVFGLCSLVIFLFKAFIFACVCYQWRRVIVAWNKFTDTTGERVLFSKDGSGPDWFSKFLMCIW